MSPTVAVKVEGLPTLLDKLRSADPIYAEPWRTAMGEATETLEERVEARAPVREGTLVGSVTRKMDTARIPLWGLVTANAENRGFRYPFALEAGKGKKRAEGTYSVTHYRSGRRKGRPTRKWFSGTMRGMRRRLADILNRAAREIEERWGR